MHDSPPDTIVMCLWSIAVGCSCRFVVLVWFEYEMVLTCVVVANETMSCSTSQHVQAMLADVPDIKF